MTDKTPLSHWNKMPGVADLPLKVRGRFAQALRAEDEAGRTTPEAEEFLARAIDAEAELNA